MARQDEYDDDRVVIVGRDNSSNGIGMMLLGLAIGAGAALLFAPASGEETRAKLQREARRAGRRVKDATDAFGEQVTDRVGRTRSRFGAQFDRARDAVDSRVNAVGEAFEAGRDAVDDTRDDLERAVADAKRAYADSRRAYHEARMAHQRGARRRDAHDDVLPSRGELLDGDGTATEG
jgi:gas vesicle protein